MGFLLEKQKLPCGMLSRSARLIAIDENTGKLAVARRSRMEEVHDYVEFYNILTGWLAVPELILCPENGSIEHMLFADNGELMTSHANGSICFIDPHNSLRVKRVQVSASSVWASCKHNMDSFGKSVVALVSHSSVLYFFDVSSKSILSSVSLGVDNRLFDVASNGTVVAIGSIDGVIIVSDGTVQRTLKLDRQNRRDPTIAWSVLFVRETTLACGDSRGMVTFWNPESGTLLHTVSCLQSHILAMCTVNGELNVSGVDPRIAVLKETSDKVFQVINRRNGPTRDVRSMAVYENTVYVAGEDSDIFTCRNGCQKLIFQQQKNVLVSGDIVASAGENFIDIWWKENGEDPPTEGCNVLRQHHEMSYIAKIYTPKKKIITCWSTSNCGRFLVLGTCTETSVYKINPNAVKLSRKVEKINTYDLVATSLCVTEQKLVLAAKADFQIVVFDVQSVQARLDSVISQNDCGSVVKMSVAPHGDFASIITTRSQVFCVNIGTGCSRLVKVDLPIDLASTTTSVVVLTSHNVHTENVDAKKVLFEVGFSNGVLKRSASSHQLRMVPTSSKSSFPGQPVYLLNFGTSKILAVSYDGYWSIVDVVANSIVSSTDCVLKTKKKLTHNHGIVITGIRSQGESEPELSTRSSASLSVKENDKNSHSRVLVLDVVSDVVPETPRFKLKTFGMQ